MSDFKNQRLIIFKSKREISLYPWQFIRDYNGWDEDLEGGVGNIELTR